MTHSMEQGDSGALLVSGWGADSPLAPSVRQHIDPVIVNEYCAANLGILVAGPPSGPARPYVMDNDVYVSSILAYNSLDCRQHVI